MTARRRTYAIIAVLVGAAAAGGATWGLTSAGRAPQAQSTAGPTAGPTRSPVSVIVPGRPGESASVVPADELPVPDGIRYNESDVHFVRMMIPHHQQAVDLAALAPTRARDARVRAIADRIAVAQGPEITVLRTWLRTRGLDEPAGGDSRSNGGHDHATMPGMATPAQLRALSDASGAAFDRMFVALMSVHHEGAIGMCGDVLRAGADERLQELATNIAAEQQIEIGRMREIIGR
jgi:uncharacterized protein (DUF305 family)